MKEENCLSGNVSGALKCFAVEYSMTSNSVHRRSLRKVIENNQSNLRKGYSSDFVPIGLFPSREQADSFIEQFNHTLAEQAQFEFRSRDWQLIASVVERLLTAQAVELAPQSIEK